MALEAFLDQNGSDLAYRVAFSPKLLGTKARKEI
jgi:hypothetical protein